MGPLLQVNKDRTLTSHSIKYTPHQCKLSNAMRCTLHIQYDSCFEKSDDIHI